MLRVPLFRLSFAILLWIKMVVPPTSGLGELKNVALNKAAYQSSIDPLYPDAVASRAVDGNTNNSWSGLSCCNTNNETNPYWKVDLGENYRIEHINIYNRVDGSLGYRSSDVRTDVSVDGTNYTQVCFHPGQIPDVYMCKSDTLVEGRWVKITITTSYVDFMNLCEVEVMVRKELFKFIASAKGTGSVLQTRNVASDTVCAYHCSRNTNCMAVNVIDRPTCIECQLLGSEDYAQTNETNTSFWKMSG